MKLTEDEIRFFDALYVKIVTSKHKYIELEPDQVEAICMQHVQNRRKILSKYVTDAEKVEPCTEGADNLHDPYFHPGSNYFK